MQRYHGHSAINRLDLWAKGVALTILLGLLAAFAVRNALGIATIGDWQWFFVGMRLTAVVSLVGVIFLGKRSWPWWTALGVSALASVSIYAVPFLP